MKSAVEGMLEEGEEGEEEEITRVENMPLKIKLHDGNHSKSISVGLFSFIVHPTFVFE